jgi:cell division protein FtsN
MTADRDSRFSPGDPPDDEFEEEEPPRSIFSAAWFRVVLVLLGIGVVGAVAVPYVLDVVNPPVDVRTAIAPPPPTPSQGVAPPRPPAPAPSAPTSSAAPAGESTRGSTPAPSAEPPRTAATPPPAPATKAPAPTPAAEKPAAKPAEKAAPKPVEKAEKPAEKAAEKPVEKMVAAKKAPAEKPAPAPRAATSAKATTGGDYFVQVGAFRDQATAKRVAAQLRDQNYPVDESVKRLGGDAPAAAPRPTPAPRASGAAPDRYDVIVSGGSSAEINTRLAAKGLASEPVGESVRIRPSLPLRDAVALSKDLGSEGFKVQVRRGGGTSAEPAPPVAAAPAPGGDAGGQTLYRVRVGGFPDRAAAQTVLKELQDKGFQPFIAKGRD